MDPVSASDRLDGQSLPQQSHEEVEHSPSAASNGSLSRETVVIIDFGSQYSRLIARRIRECGVYCELIPYSAPWETIQDLNPKGVVLSGGPASVYEPGAPLAPEWVYSSGLPLLGICYGMQAMAHQLGGRVAPTGQREYGHAELHHGESSGPIFRDIPSPMPVWMSHGDNITELPPGFRVLAHTKNSPVAVLGDANLKAGPPVPPGGSPHAPGNEDSSATSCSTCADARATGLQATSFRRRCTRFAVRWETAK